MLCSHHHHRVHRDGWLVFIRDGRSWFVPPAHLDSSQTARAGNLATDHLIRQHLAKRRRRAAAASPISTSTSTSTGTGGGSSTSTDGGSSTGGGGSGRTSGGSGSGSGSGNTIGAAPVV